MGSDRAGSDVEERWAGLRPQHLASIAIVVDSILFLAAGLIAAARVAAAPSSFFVLAEVLTTALLALLFVIFCRIARLHDPLLLWRDRFTEQLVRAMVCFGAPAIAALLIALPFSNPADAATHHFIGWLRWFAALSLGFAVASRLLVLPLWPRAMARVFVPQRVAVVGSGEPAKRLIQWIEQTAPQLVDIVGVFDDRGPDRTSGSEIADMVLGPTANLIEHYQKAPFDTIVVALPHYAEERVFHLLRKLHQLPVDIVLAPDLIGFRTARQGAMEMAGLQLYSLAHRPIREPQRLLKGAIDRSVAGLALLALSPLLIAVALAVKLDSPGPIFFRQKRQGLGDRLFDVFKFRTMQQRQVDEAVGVQQTRREDPRVTRVGYWLRRSSIDELPQLFNVLLGDMSLVGPRPHTPHMLIGEQRIFDLVDEYSFRHRVKPGITGLAQVNGCRGAIDTPEQLRDRVRYDLYYIDHWSLWLDVKILFRTAAICVAGTNAF
jgi:Undecaprenyl-phosphate glucose phosphotransferase